MDRAIHKCIVHYMHSALYMYATTLALNGTWQIHIRLTVIVNHAKFVRLDIVLMIEYMRLLKESLNNDVKLVVMQSPTCVSSLMALSPSLVCALSICSINARHTHRLCEEKDIDTGMHAFFFLCAHSPSHIFWARLASVIYLKWRGACCRCVL